MLIFITDTLKHYPIHKDRVKFPVKQRVRKIVAIRSFGLRSWLLHRVLCGNQVLCTNQVLCSNQVLLHCFEKKIHRTR